MTTTIPADQTAGNALPESYLDDVVTMGENLRDRERTLFVPFLSGTSGYDTGGWISRFAVMQLSSTMVSFADFVAPNNMGSLTAAYLVFGANATESGTIDVLTYYGADDQPATTHSGSISNLALSLTQDDLYNTDDIAAALASLAAGDIVGVRVSSDDVHIKLIGLQIEYRAD